MNIGKKLKNKIISKIPKISAKIVQINKSYEQLFHAKKWIKYFFTYIIVILL